MATITIDPNYGYVLLAATSTFFLGLVHSANTSKYRKAAAIPYPAAYAPSSRTDPEAQRFNCAQRAHANYTENQLQVVGGLFIAGLRYPLSAAVMGGLWSVARYMYMYGYSQGGEGGKGRYKNGALTHTLFQIGLMGLSGYTGLALVMGW